MRLKTLMQGGKVWAVLTAILCYTVPGSGQSTGYRKEYNEAGTLINQDYFTAKQFREVSELLLKVDRAHVVGHAGSVMKNLRRGAYDYVIYDAQYALERFPNHPKALMLLTTAALLSKRPMLPRPYFEKAIQLYPQYAQIRAQYAHYLVDGGAVDEGVAMLKNVVETDPNLVIGHVWLAQAYHKQGKLDLAVEEAAKAKGLGFNDEILPSTN
jgi:predicted Zn-dependent protease